MNTAKIYKYTISVRPWPELNGETSYACCFFNSKTRKKNALIPMKAAGQTLSEIQWKLFEYYAANGWTFVVTFASVALAAAFFQPFADAKAARKKELVEQSRMPRRKQAVAAQ